ncbi:hypothetical protein [Pseudoalteromonas sp. R3]|uniref:hypothetical protein n=1 Tax=Pseudoalteromonas sp. R3 TaxID=1709477 RepID=UPI0006B69491|nr:hypothetical protein [Pseudoalteromonas sp. R3]AZZ97992.1 hypothetical protein ELR70_13235 [Pseudoalteromonas sp. R3]
MTAFALIKIFVCLYISVKSIRAFLNLEESNELTWQEAEQQAHTPQAHKLCMQSYESRQMANTFDKIQADKEYEEALIKYIEDLATIKADNTVSIIKQPSTHKPTKLKAVK